MKITFELKNVPFTCETCGILSSFLLKNKDHSASYMERQRTKTNNTTKEHITDEPQRQAAAAAFTDLLLVRKRRYHVLQLTANRYYRL